MKYLLYGIVEQDLAGCPPWNLSPDGARLGGCGFGRGRDEFATQRFLPVGL